MFNKQDFAAMLNDMPKWAAYTALFCIYIVVIFAFMLVAGMVINILWAWIVPDILTGSVQQGLVPASITLNQAMKLGLVFTGVMGTIYLMIYTHMEALRKLEDVKIQQNK